MTAVRTRGGTPLYRPCRCVPPWKVGFLGLFGLKTLCPFWSGIGYGFRVNYGSVHVWRYLLFQFQMNKNEIEICEFQMHLKNSCFSLRPNLILNDDIISALPSLACSRLRDSWVRWIRKREHENKAGGNWESPLVIDSLEHAKLGQVWKWVWILEIWSKNEFGKRHF